MTRQRYLVLAAIIVFGTVGNILLTIGMKRLGPVTAERWYELILAVFNPWVAAGIVLLLGFFAAYLTALSWADLTFVLPAAALDYVLMALLAQLFLGEQVSLTRWLGIILVSVGVGVVSTGPVNTTAAPEPAKVGSVAGGEL